jgi:hypothetical protein
MDSRKCSACGQDISPSLAGKYCYRHQQVYDSLLAEYKALSEVQDALLWKDFLLRKLDENGQPDDVKQVIDVELK